ncbi:MAG: hypothetical protein HQK52_20335 [Oligoflexia bacterium]|nr:hypothetical protein [Oligoflexia bacterium]
MKKSVRITNFYGLVIKRSAIDMLPISIKKIDEAMEMKPLDINEQLISYGPSFGQEAADEFIRRLESLGLKHIDDFFVFEGDYPDWISFSAELAKD